MSRVRPFEASPGTPFRFGRKETVSMIARITFAAMITFVSGCNDAASKSVASSNDSSAPLTNTNNADLVTANAIVDSPLIGTWLGSGAIDEAAITKVFATLSADKQEQLAAQAENFLATQMAIEFRSDATVETAIEILSADGKKEAGTALARWEAKQTADDTFEVTSTETGDKESNTTTTKTWKLSADGKQLSLDVPMPGTLLENCQTSIILDRQIVEAPHMAGDNNPESTVR